MLTPWLLASGTSLILLALIFRKSRKMRRAGHELKQLDVARDRLHLFALWTLFATSALTAILFLGGGWLYESLGSESFIRTASGEGKFDAQSYVGMLSAILGIPLAITGAFFAIYLSQVSLAIAESQVELTRRQLIHDHPLYGSFERLWVIKARVEWLLVFLRKSDPETHAGNFQHFVDAVKRKASEVIDELTKRETKDLLIVTGAFDKGSSDFENALIDASNVAGSLSGSRAEIQRLEAHLKVIHDVLPDRKRGMEVIRERIDE